MKAISGFESVILPNNSQRDRHFRTNKLSHKQSFTTFSVAKQLKMVRATNRAGVTSSFLFIVLVLAIIFPLYNIMGTEDTKAAVGTAVDSGITFTSTRATATVDLTPTSASGTFASSTSGTTDAAFSITTTNSQGYELKIKSTSGTVLKPTTTTEDSDGLSTISTSGITSSSFTNNTWGYLPNYYNCNEVSGTCTTNTTNYYPATTSDVTLRKTTSANNTAHNYTIGLGAKADLTKTSGTYTLGGNKGSLALTYVANPTVYEIAYDKGEAASDPGNMPSTQSGSVSATSVTLSSVTPTLTGYTFTGWCLGEVNRSSAEVDSCTGTGAKTFAAGSTFGIDRTSTNSVTLHAMWSKASVNVTVNFAGSGVTGVTFTNTTYGNATVSTSGNTAALKYGVSYTITGTYSSGYEFSSWAATAGSLGSTSSASTTYSTTSAATLTLTGKSSCSTITFKTSNASSIVFNGTSYTNNQTTCVANGTYAIYGTYATKYAWQSWSATAGTFGNQSYQNTTYTVTGNATITLTGQSVTLAMQNLSSSNCTTTARPVYDTRDNSVYWVQKLADDKCWMLDNLALDLTNSTIVNILSTSNTNLDTTALSYFKNGGGSTDDRYPTAAYTNWTSGFSFSQPMINASDKDIVLVSMDAPTTPNHKQGAYGPGQNKVGAYYNYCAASVGYYCYGDNYSQGTSSGDNSYDVCPTGWRMPTGNTSGEYNALYTNSTIGSNADNYRIALSAPFSGYFYYGMAFDQSFHGHFWSSTWNDNYSMYEMAVDRSKVYPASYSYRSYGGSVRCVLKPTMQDATSSSLANLMPNVGDTATLVDSRDGESYLIGHLADGKYWMLDNLRLGSTATISLDSSNTNLPSGVTWTLPASGSWSITYTTAYIISSDKDKTTTSYGSGSGKIGVYYNYCAASAGDICDYYNPNTGSADRDICPKGWRIPKGGSSGEYNALYTNSAIGSDPTKYRTALSTPLSGTFDNGSVDSGSARYQGSYGYFWSSTRMSNNSSSDAYFNMHGLFVDSSNVYPTSTLDRKYAYSVRCVLK